jgi:hypothetical protein
MRPQRLIWRFSALKGKINQNEQKNAKQSQFPKRQK